MKIRRALLAIPLFVATLAPVVAAKDNKPMSDDFVSDSVRRKLASDAIVKGGALDVQVKDGIVTLTGKVELEKQKQKAEKLVKKVNGVKGVVNQIQIAQH